MYCMVEGEPYSSVEAYILSLFAEIVQVRRREVNGDNSCLARRDQRYGRIISSQINCFSYIIPRDERVQLLNILLRIIVNTVSFTLSIILLYRIKNPKYEK